MKNRIKTFFLFFLTCFFLQHQDLSAQTRWLSFNPGGGGAFNSVSAGLNDHILVGSDLSGVYLSKNLGGRWFGLGSAHGLTSTHVSSVAHHKTDDRWMCVGTDYGIFRSTNRGRAWEQTLVGGYIDALAYATVPDRIMYAAHQATWNNSTCTVYKSLNTGRTWAQVSTNFPTGLHILKFVIHPTDADIVYAITGEGRFASGPKRYYKSTDGGVTWSNFAAQFNDRAMDLALKPNDPNTVYCTTYEEAGFANGAFWRSTNNGASWSRVATERTGVIWLNPNIPNRVRLVDVRNPYPWNGNGEGVWESTNSGNSWTKISSVTNWEPGWNEIFWVWNPSFQGVVKTLGFSLSDPNKCYWQTSQFVFGWDETQQIFKTLCSTEPNSNEWKGTRLDNIVPARFSISAAQPGLVYLGLFDMGLWKSDNRGVTWRSCNTAAYTGGWQGYGGNCLSVVADPTDPNKVWATLVGDIGQNVNFLKSTAQGDPTSWTATGAGLPATGSMYGLSLDPNSAHGNRTLFIVADGDVYRSQNDGNNFTKVFDCNECRHTTVDQFNSNLVYAGGEGGVWRSLNGGSTWTQVGISEMQGSTSGDYYNWGWTGVSSIVTDPNTSGTVYVTAVGNGKGLWRSTNQGTSWTKLYTNDFMRSVAVRPGNSSIMFTTSSSAFLAGGYDASSRGVLYSENGGASWQQRNAGLPWKLVHQIEFDPTNDRRVYINQMGNGFHRQLFDFPSTAGPIAEARTKQAGQASFEVGRLNISPNPCTDFARFDFENGEEKGGAYVFQVLSTDGKLQFEQAVSLPFVWENLTLPTGIYNCLLLQKGRVLHAALLFKE